MITGSQFLALQRLFTGDDNFVEEACDCMGVEPDSDDDRDIKIIEAFIEKVQAANPDGIDEGDEPISLGDEDESEEE